ncbi:helix-turn-helix domain-containing protein [Bosea minatitlanensis]|uniref:Helix-turn-helix domain-containing protein n=1 Tax=Bosea minatitlanensis TaxID=128782 RepID=A0ABW0F199_9HYPH|nr:helix-turn-helix domain-containing protein [Bosea minatitlanensis]MCT4491787.1 helix-turn-helix domain-containing protein [Bosea minatitlanensis]
MTRPGWPDLPPLLAEIAEVAGLDAALAIAEAKGGQQVFIVAHLRPDNWLVRAVGLDKARVVSDHFCSGRLRQKLTIPLGPAGSYQALRRRTARALEEAASRGASANQMAAAAGVTTRTVHRFRSRQRQHNSRDQLKLL